MRLDISTKNLCIYPSHNSGAARHPWRTFWWMTETKASQMNSDSFHFTKLSFRVSQYLPNILSQMQKGNASTLACIWALDCSAAAWGGTLRAMAKKRKKQAVAPKLRKNNAS